MMGKENFNRKYQLKICHGIDCRGEKTKRIELGYRYCIRCRNLMKGICEDRSYFMYHK